MIEQSIQRQHQQLGKALAVVGSLTPSRYQALAKTSLERGQMYLLEIIQVLDLAPKNPPKPPVIIAVIGLTPGKPDGASDSEQPPIDKLTEAIKAIKANNVTLGLTHLIEGLLEETKTFVKDIIIEVPGKYTGNKFEVDTLVAESYRCIFEAKGWLKLIPPVAPPVVPSPSN
jgi:hypothetical protein